MFCKQKTNKQYNVTVSLSCLSSKYHLYLGWAVQHFDEDLCIEVDAIR